MLKGYAVSCHSSEVAFCLVGWEERQVVKNIMIFLSGEILAAGSFCRRHWGCPCPSLPGVGINTSRQRSDTYLSQHCQL